MAKAFFRFMRGELNGFYLSAINNTLNVATSSIKEQLIKIKNTQFDTNSMSRETIYNIGKFAGIYPLWLLVSDFYGTARMTESAVYNGEQRNERGLLNRATETFQFEHVNDETSPDINVLANSNLKSTMYGEEDEIKGYIDSSESDVLDENANVKEEKILHVLPSGIAYSDFYGNKFLILEDEDVKLRLPINVDSFYMLYENMQHVRYNGANIKSLCAIIEALCPDGFMQIVSIDKNESAPAFRIKYRVDYDSPLINKTQRIALVSYIVSTKFTQFYLEEEIEPTGE